MINRIKKFFSGDSRVKVPTILQAAKNLGCVAKGFRGRPLNLKKKKLKKISL